MISHAPAVISGQDFGLVVGIGFVTVCAAPLAFAVPVVTGTAGIQTGEWVIASTLGLLETGYQRAPILVVVLGLLLILPIVAFISVAVRNASREKARRHIQHLELQKAQLAQQMPADTADAPIPAWPNQAWLSIEGDPAAATHPISGQIMRIGRHQDNDIRLPDTSVHRYHAVIQRTAGETFVITDVSGEKGNGLRVNGMRMAQAQLVDGDLIELGRARLRFESAPI
jgi:hypothetical protein